jgi:hypothetical protein
LKKKYVDEQRWAFILENLAVLFVRSYQKSLILTASVRPSTLKQELNLPRGSLERDLGYWAFSVYPKVNPEFKQIYSM